MEEGAAENESTMDPLKKLIPGGLDVQ